MAQRQRTVSIQVEEEMKRSYIDYSMSVIVSRALPDVRDGLKPVQRRILVAMNDLRLTHDRPYRKSAKISGDVNGNYHPHGTMAIYDAMVRMAQGFSLRYPLVDGQGNFGSIDGDAPAAERYTEARMAQISEDMLADLEKDTVDFMANYDGTRQEPTVLPSTVPQLLINGASGIAVGMATNVPPHNLKEITSGLITLIDDPDADDNEILKHVQGPDFPTGGIIYGVAGIREAYLTGKGRLTVRARANVETDSGGKERIVVTEIPYQVNKARLIETVANLVRGGKIEGIRDIRDESDKEGMRIVIELKSNAQPQVILNQLFKHTPMQTTFGVIMLALDKNQPRVLKLKEAMQLFLEHREEVIIRRTKFDLQKAEERAHILEGLKIALDNIDEIVELIKKSKDVDTARSKLMKQFKLSERQAQAILDMRLQRLTGLQRQKVEDDYRETIKLIAELKSILESRAKVLQLIKEELLEIRDRYGDDRRTDIIEKTEEFNLEDLIAEEDMVITITHSGYIKRLPVGTYRRQARGGKGVIGMETKEEDFVQYMFIASTHQYMLFFTNLGRCYWQKVHSIPQAGRAAKGKAIVNLLQLGKDEKVTAFVPVREFDDEHYLFMATRKGMVKKTVLSAFGNPRRGGIIAISLKKGDELIAVSLTEGTQDVILGKRQGLAIRFSEKDVRPMGRNAAGVIGTKLDKGDEVVDMIPIKRIGTLLTATQNGFGKRTKIEDYRTIGRGGRGVITIRTTKRNGMVVAVLEVTDNDEVMMMTKKGQVIRLPMAKVSIIGRNTQGVRLMNLQSGDEVTDVAHVVSREKEATATESAKKK
jgi:DNA gyrase subunit A